MKLLKLAGVLASTLISNLVIPGGEHIIQPIFPGIGGGAGGIIIDPGVEYMYTGDLLSSFKMEPLRRDGGVSKGIISTSNRNILASSKAVVKIYNEYYEDGVTIFTVQRKGDLLATFTYDNQYTRNNNRISIEVTVDSDSETYTSDISVASSSTKVINSSPYSFSTTTPGIQYLNGTWSTPKVKYTFTNFDNEYVPTYYHNLSLKDYKITTSGGYVPSLDCKNIYLYITNRNGIFDDLPNNGDYAILPLKIVKDGTTYGLNFKDFYYVNPSTLLMSKDPKPGYVETNHLYFPHNEMRYQGEYEGRIIFQGFGVEDLMITYLFKLNATLNLLGDCYNSEYCVLTNKANIESGNMND